MHMRLVSCSQDVVVLTGAGYIIMRLLKMFRHITLPSGQRIELVAVEKQDMTLVITVQEGCKVEID
jgi:hypothetical protein